MILFRRLHCREFDPYWVLCSDPVPDQAKLCMHLYKQKERKYIYQRRQKLSFPAEMKYVTFDILQICKEKRSKILNQIILSMHIMNKSYGNYIKCISPLRWRRCRLLGFIFLRNPYLAVFNFNLEMSVRFTSKEMTQFLYISHMFSHQM